MGSVLIAVGCAVVALALGFCVGILATRQAVRECEAKLDILLAHWVDSCLAEGPWDED
ncbi:hypothetical protein ACIF85_35290 [Streptomyces sp. NPDC086033]|uniref:hypothetical protein n=1 Tax=Streptomyces sp. NPDC086033 TaxID=3365747 RepID=UPI0037CF9993